MGWLCVELGVLACILLYGRSSAFWLAVVATLGIFWTYGIMHNYATESAKRRPDYTGAFYDLDEQDVASVPDWLAGLNLLLTLCAAGLCIYGGYIAVKR